MPRRLAPSRSQKRRPAPQRRSFEAPASLEWTLLTALLADLTLVEHIDADRLAPERPETLALLAIREKCEAAEDLSFALLMDALSGHACLETVLKALKYAEDLAFDVDSARGEFQHALTGLEVRSRKKELDELRGRLRSKEDLVSFNEKNLAYQRLRGALPSP